ncbi:hypothetical protein [Streptomyces chromofuscus]|uniref:hypothetical protein n=1 Tax=Streptomyces chromofuscus TaxID=42881 RepID=UPI003570E173
MRVNALVAGLADTPLPRAFREADPEAAQDLVNRQPSGRASTEEETAAFTSFLLGDESPVRQRSRPRRRRGAHRRLLTYLPDPGHPALGGASTKGSRLGVDPCCRRCSLRAGVRRCRKRLRDVLAVIGRRGGRPGKDAARVAGSAGDLVGAFHAPGVGAARPRSACARPCPTPARGLARPVSVRPRCAYVSLARCLASPDACSRGPGGRRANKWTPSWTVCPILLSVRRALLSAGVRPILRVDCS